MNNLRVLLNLFLLLTGMSATNAQVVSPVKKKNISKKDSLSGISTKWRADTIKSGYGNGNQNQSIKGGEVSKGYQFGLKPLSCKAINSTQELIIDPRDFMYHYDDKAYFIGKVKVYENSGILLCSFNDVYTNGEDAFWSVPYAYLPLQDGEHSLYATCELASVEKDGHNNYTFQSSTKIIYKESVLTIEDDDENNHLYLKLNYPDYPLIKHYNDERPSDFRKIIGHREGSTKVSLINASDDKVIFQTDIVSILTKLDISKFDMDLTGDSVYAIVEYFYNDKKDFVTTVKSKPISVTSKLNLSYRLDTLRSGVFNSLYMELNGGTYSRFKWSAFTYFTNSNSEIMNGWDENSVKGYSTNFPFYAKYELENLTLPTGRHSITPHIVLKSDKGKVLNVDFPPVHFNKKTQAKYWRLKRYRITNPQTGDVEVPVFSRNQHGPDYYMKLNGRVIRKNEIGKLLLGKEHKIDFTVMDEDVFIDDYEGSAKCENCLSLLDASEEIEMSIMNKKIKVGDVRASLKNPEIFRTKEIKILNEVKNDTMGFVDVKWSILQSDLDSIKFLIKDRGNEQLLPFWVNQKSMDSLLLKEPKGNVDIVFRVPYWYFVRSGDFILSLVGYKDGILPSSDNLSLPGIILNKELKSKGENQVNPGLNVQILPVVRRNGLLHLPVKLSLSTSLKQNLFIGKMKFSANLNLSNFKSGDRIPSIKEKKLVVIDTTVVWDNDTMLVYFPFFDSRIPANTPFAEGGMCYLEETCYLLLDSSHKIQITQKKVEKFRLDPIKYRNFELKINDITLKRKLPKGEDTIILKYLINGNEAITLPLKMRDRIMLTSSRTIYFSCLAGDVHEFELFYKNGKSLCNISLKDLFDFYGIKFPTISKRNLKQFKFTLYCGTSQRQ